jgi:hypothetical protein
MKNNCWLYKALFFSIISVLVCCKNKPTIDYTSVKKTLQVVAAKDQYYRTSKQNFEQSLQEVLDKQNQEVVIKILDSLGWLGPKQIGDSASDALFLTIQHSNVRLMEKYLPMMKKAVELGDASKEGLALLIDRVEMLNYRPQIYGSQMNYVNGKLEVYLLKDFAHVDSLRATMNLEPLKDYVKRFDE